jgi:hypothetical protein
MATAAPAGYSGKPIWQKLGLDAKHRVLVRGAPSDYAKLVGLRADDLYVATPRSGFDIAHVFETSAAKLKREIEALAKKLPAAGTIWVSWPKKSAKVATDITEDSVRAIALPLGLVDVKVCAIDATWSGLKLVWRLENRKGRS